MAKKKFYAVKEGINPGIYTNWDDCKKQIDGFSGAIYKGFATESEAEDYLNEVEVETPKKSENKVYDLPCTDTPYAFVDGSYNDSAKVYGYGGFLMVNGKEYRIQGHNNLPGMLEMRNVAGEMCGCINAVRKAYELNLKELDIYYDYQGIESWATGEWKAKKNETQMYARTMKRYMNVIKITFKKVTGHSGCNGNDTADLMAKKAVGLS